MPIPDEAVKVLCEADGKNEPTTVTARKISSVLFKHFLTRLDLELESCSTTAVAIDFNGSLKELDRYRKALAKTRERMKSWALRETEGF